MPAQKTQKGVSKEERETLARLVAIAFTDYPFF